MTSEHPGEHDMTDNAIAASNCISAAQTRDAYLKLSDSGVCGGAKAMPCMRDTCAHCGPLNTLIDELGDACEQRGCTLKRCVFDVVLV